MKNLNERNGFAEKLNLSCVHCNEVLSEGFSSPKNIKRATSPGPKPFYINDALMLFFKEANLGHKAMAKLGAILGIDVLHNKTFEEKSLQLNEFYVDQTEEVLKQAADVVRQIHGVTAGGILDLSVSYDGSWLTRGYKSHFGFAAIIELITGLVLDYVIISKYCHACECKAAKVGGKTTEKFKEWYKDHENDCLIDYEGSSGGMEVRGAEILFPRSIEKHNFR